MSSVQLIATRMTLVLLAGVVHLSPARADFVLVEDFEDYLPGSISTQNGWKASSPTTVVDLDPENSENQVLSVTTNSTFAHLDILGVNSPILNGTVRMAFLRFRVGSQQNYSFGFTHVTNPSEFSDFGPEVGMSNSSLDLRQYSTATATTMRSLSRCPQIPGTTCGCWSMPKTIPPGCGLIRPMTPPRMTMR